VDIARSIDTKNLNNLQNKLKDKKMVLIDEAFAQEKIVICPFTVGVPKMSF
jgi:hypothetical protein